MFYNIIIAMMFTKHVNNIVIYNKYLYWKS